MSTLRILFFSLLMMLAMTATHAGELVKYNGSDLPDFTLNDMLGKPQSLSDYKGKVVLLNFWATWCPPCVKEMPSMQRVQDQLKTRGLEVVAVNMGDEVADVEQFLQRVPVQFPILMDLEGEVLKSWRVVAFPTTFILDRDGSIQYALFGGFEWDSPEAIETLESLL